MKEHKRNPTSKKEDVGLTYKDKKDLFLRKNTYNKVCPTPHSCSQNTIVTALHFVGIIGNEEETRYFIQQNLLLEGVMQTK